MPTPATVSCRGVITRTNCSCAPIKRVLMADIGSHLQFSLNPSSCRLACLFDASDSVSNDRAAAGIAFYLRRGTTAATSSNYGPAGELLRADELRDKFHCGISRPAHFTVLLLLCTSLLFRSGDTAGGRCVDASLMLAELPQHQQPLPTVYLADWRRSHFRFCF